jgi:hypothetical protein
MNRQDRGILVGMVFGDGCLRVRERLWREKYKYVQSELRMKHSHIQRAYLEYKAELVNKMFGGNATVNTVQTKLKGKSYEQCLYTKSNKYFKALRRVMYPNGKKIFTRQSLNYLTPHGIAIWFMDDGHARVNVDNQGWVSSISSEIATCCSLQEIEDIKAYFKEIHDIDIKPYRYGKGTEYWCFRMNTANTQEFARIISPYVIPSMRYKLANVANLNVQECRAQSSICTSCGSVSYGNDRRGGKCTKCYSKDAYKRRRDKLKIVKI